MTIPSTDVAPDRDPNEPAPSERLKRLYREAAAEQLAILVWGPAEDDSLEFRKRREIRDALKADGHWANFSEDIAPPEGADWDPLDAELLQAKASDLIVVLYGSRGTQSEIDRLLIYDEFASKAAIFIDAAQYAKVRTSVSKGTWEKLARRAHGLVEYTPDELAACRVVTQVMDLAKKARVAVYVARLKAQLAA